ncbi:MAG: MOFRL family protein, partial [Candidatus Cloacimonadaceae bacterium]
ALAEEEGWTFIAYATDGNDNIVESSGACVNGFSYAQMQAAGVDVEKAIREGDSYTALSKIGAILPGGYTGTNVNEAYIFQGSR